MRFSHIFITKKDYSIEAIQSAHSRPTPRFGGILIIFSFAVFGLHSEIVSANLIIGLLPLIFIGLLEDLKIETRPRYRLIVATISAVYCILYYCGPISQIDFLPLKSFLSTFPIALSFTAFAIVGMINAVNVIDGLNGFSGFQSITMLGAIATLAFNVGDPNILSICLLLISGVIGFLLLNFPKGYIFMGDAGTYSIGLIIACLSIKLHNEHSNISSWAILLILLWPVSDLLMSIYRRIKRKADTKKADFLHYHHVVMRYIEMLQGSKRDRSKSNPTATLILAPVSCLPALIATVTYSNPTACFLAVVIFGISFVVSYTAALKFVENS